MTLTKQEACALLHISDSTMTRRMRAGQYKFTRTGSGQYAAVSFTYADLGLVELSPAVAVEVVPEPEPRPAPAPAVERIPTLQECGLPITEDSLGNPVHGPATKYSLLGPNPSVERRPKPGLFDHMNPALIGQTKIGVDGQPIFDAASDNHPLTAALIAQGKMQPTKATKSRYPNQTRQEFLTLIFQDIGRGYSR